MALFRSSSTPKEAPSVKFRTSDGANHTNDDYEGL